MSRNDWEKSPNDRKEEAFHASDETRARAKTKKVDKPFSVQIRYKKVNHQMFEFLLAWNSGHKFKTLELARAYVKKLKREAWSDRKDIRIVDKEGNEYALD